MYAAAAKERGADADVLHGAGRLHCAIYLQGYVVECLLKDILDKRRKPFPRRGAGGHDLQALLHAAGIKISDVGDAHRRYFLESWTTSMRYETKSDSSVVQEADVFQGAKGASSYLVKLAKRDIRKGARRRGTYRR